ncbi:MAG: thymidine phosphorylase [Ignavibacteriales bacterium]|nr:thymidine phosphorylase [Ignavibacteriales bacterium]
MNPVEIIIKKRDGLELSDKDFEFFIGAYTAGEVPDYQASALLMAIFFKGLTQKEILSLTKTMLYSGTIIDLSDIPEQKIGKHSTGGVGDKTTLILTPIVAAAGLKVPQISGRGLGHTGGTLDKMEAIPGVNTRLSIKDYRNMIRHPGALIIGQTADIAPADKLLYALRDVTGTVPSMPLITASIMSKKLAEGTDGLVLDVKTGSGAFMKSFEDSLKLAETLLGIAKGFGKKGIALITEMSQPLGFMSGNWNEVHESIDVMRGEYIEDLCEITYAISGAMLKIGGKVETIEEGADMAKKLVVSGKAFDKFLEMVSAQGGDISIVVNPEKYPKSSYKELIAAPATGFVHSIDGYEIGMALIELGAGRMKKEDDIDFKAGLCLKAKVGDFYYKGQSIGYIEGENEDKILSVKARILKAINFNAEKCEKLKLIKQIIY